MCYIELEMKNEVVLRFGLFDFDDINHDEITQLLGLQPSKVYIKGQKRNPKNPDSSLIKRNGWLVDAPTEKYSSFEEQMELFGTY